MSFQGKVVVITGGGSGIGETAAARLLERGARVVINGRREDVLARTAKRLDQAGDRVRAVAGDIASPATAKRLVETAEREFGSVDILINNAGIFSPKPFIEHSEEDFDTYVAIILKGTFFASQAVIPSMRRRGGGAIVNVGSMWGSQAIGATPSSAYSAAKAGVHALTKNLAIELAADHIRVNAVAPAVVQTPVYDSFLPAAQVETVLHSFNAFHPLGRIGQPQDVVSALLFLAGEEASWITGAVLPVDGGVMAGRNT